MVGQGEQWIPCFGRLLGVKRRRSDVCHRLISKGFAHLSGGMVGDLEGIL